MSLPNTYKRLEYIQSSGTQYIDTLYKNQTEKTKVELDCEITNASNNLTLYGNYVLSSNGSYIYTYQNSITCSIGVHTQATRISCPLNTRTIVSLETKSDKTYIWSAFGTSHTTSQSGSAINTRTNTLFTGSSGDGTIYTKGYMKLYSCKMWDNDILVRDFIPALRVSDNEAGLYDLVNDTFYTNQGTGVFTYPTIEISGNVSPQNSGTIDGLGFYSSGGQARVEAIANQGYEFENWLLKGYTQLEYIQSDGNQYIDLGFKANYNTTKIEIKLNSQYVDGVSAIFGSEWAMSGYFLMFYYNNIRWHSASSVDVPCQLNTDYVITTTKDNVIVNGQSYSVSPSSVLTNYDLRLYATNGGYGTDKGKFKTLYMKVWDNDILVRDLIPVIRHSDGAIGLLDLVNLTFYGNSGTGEFIGGNAL